MQQELTRKLEKLQLDFQAQLADQERQLNQTKSDLSRALGLVDQLKADQDGFRALKGAVETVAKKLEELEKRQIVKERIRRGYELEAQKERFQALAQALIHVRFQSRSIYDLSVQKQLDLESSLHTNIESIAPGLVRKVQSLARRVPSLEGLIQASPLAGNPLIAVGIGLITSILPKQSVQAMEDAKDVVAVASALQEHRESTNGLIGRYAELASSAKAVEEGADALFIETFLSLTGKRPGDSSAERSATIITVIGTYFNDQRKRIENASASAGIAPATTDTQSGRTLSRADQNQAPPEDPEILLRSSVQLVDSLQRKAVILVAKFRPLVSSLTSSLEAQAAGIEAIRGRLLPPGSIAKEGTVRAEMSAKLTESAKKYKDQASESSTARLKEVDALERLASG